MSFYDDFYDEPSEFEQQIYEFKQSLVQAVKQEYRNEMDRLRRENAELQEFKEQKKAIKREYELKLRKVHMEKQQFEENLKDMRLTELLGKNILTGWSPSWERVEPPKCDKCDERRKIHYKTPSGRDATEECPDCSKSSLLYFPEKVECFRFEQSKRKYDGEYHINFYFRREKREDYDTFREERHIYKGEDFEKLPKYDVITFWDKKTCQEYCDWRTENAQ